MKIKLTKIFLTLFFSFPILILIKFFKINFSFEPLTLFWALKNSIIQSFITAFFSVLIGFVLSLGIASANVNLRTLLRKLVLVPVFLPSLFIILITFSIIQPFPFGTIGIVLILSLIYVGYATAQISLISENLIGSLAFTAEIYQVKRIRYLYKIALPILFKPMVNLFFIIFASCFTSFSVPLLVGAGKGTNFEVLIYEKIFIEQNWSQALSLSIIQMMIIFILTLTLKNRSNQNENKNVYIANSYHKSNLGLFLVLGYISFIFFGYAKLIIKSISSVTQKPAAFYSLFQEIISATGQSLVLFLVILTFFIFLLYFVLFLIYQNKTISFLDVFINPSVVITGFSIYLVFSQGQSFFDYLKVSLVFAITTFISFFKSQISNSIDQLKKQFFISQVYSISYNQCLKDIIWPQLKSVIIFAISILFLYSISDFTSIRSTGSSVQNLGLLMSSYLQSYRTEYAFIISLYILVLWVIFNLILGVLFGQHKKS